MSRTIDYYFSFSSPWAFIGHDRLAAVARRHGATLAWYPVLLGDLFAQTGGLPLPRRHPARQRYRMVELQRWRHRLGLDFNLRPAFWPFDATLADKVLIAALEAGHAVDPFARRVFAGVWQRQENLADPDTLRAVLAEVGLPGDLVAQAAGENIVGLYARNHDRAIAADVFGSPSYVLEGEVFWGQDRIDLLDEALSEGRAPFSPDV